MNNLDGLLDDILTRWLNDMNFRKELKANPQEALEKAGFSLDKDQLNIVKKKLIDNLNTDLEKKLNK